MTTGELREYKVLVKEAELLNASNDFVYKFYKDSEKYSTEIDDILEANLLSRNDPFLDIVLAQYCQHGTTIFNLFSKAAQSDDLPLKLACLSNDSFSSSIGSIPSALFGENHWDDCPLLLEWLKSISNVEIEALFSNKTIDRHWLACFLECENKFWSILTKDQQRHILRSLSKNSLIQHRDNEFFIDGQSEYDHNKLFHSIWSLAEKIPTSRPYAAALANLLGKTAFVRSHFDVVETVKRWDIVDRTEVKTKTELHLNNYELIRYYLYRNIVKDLYGSDCSNTEHFDNSDIAYRCCSYSQLQNITIDDMNLIVEKDGALAVNYLLMNDNLWIFEETREALQSLCYKADRKEPNGISFCTNYFLIRKEKMEELNPKWFIEKIFDESDPDDKLLNIATMRVYLEALKHDSINTVVDLSKIFAKELFKTGLILYAILGIVLVILFK